MEDSNTAFFYLNTIETVANVIENIFTIQVFWKNRATLKLSSYFLGNLASCLKIRKRLSQRDPCLDMARDKQNVSGLNAKVSRTFYIVIATSLVRWFPCIVIYCVNFLCSKCLLTYLIHLSTTLRLANSLINPIIQSFRILTFRETLLRIIICKKS